MLSRLSIVAKRATQGEKCSGETRGEEGTIKDSSRGAEEREAKKRKP